MAGVGEDLGFLPELGKKMNAAAFWSYREVEGVICLTYEGLPQCGRVGFAPRRAPRVRYAPRHPSNC